MADGKIQLELVTPARRVLSQPVDEVRAPGAAGGFGVLPGHTEFISLMKPGELVIVSGGQQQVFAVGEGFAQVAGDKVIVLAETVDRAEEIDLAGTREEIEVETKKLAALKRDSAEYEVQRARVERAAAKALVASRHLK